MHKRKKFSILFILLLGSLLYTTLLIKSSDIFKNQVKKKDSIIHLHTSLHAPIGINGNLELENFPNKTGSGTSWNDPYIIEDLEIMGSGLGTAINISSTNKYLVIKDCFIKNFEDGIALENTTTIKIKNISISNINGIGNLIKNSSRIYIEENNFVNNGCGIEIDDSNLNWILRNSFSDHSSSIILFNSLNNTISENNCSKNEFSAIIIKMTNKSTINNNNCSNSYGYGILGLDSENNTISENIFINNSEHSIELSYCDHHKIFKNNCSYNHKSGIYLYHSNANNLSKNHISNNSDHGIYMEESNCNNLRDINCSKNLMNGFYLYNSDNNKLSKNFLFNNTENGIYFLRSNYTELNDNCVLYNQFQGIFLDDSKGTNLFNDKIHNNNEWGLYLYYSNINTISQLISYRNQRGGVAIDHSNYNEFTNNNITKNNGDGYLLWDSCNNSVIRNTIIENKEYGIGLDNSNNNLIFLNSIINSTWYNAFSISSNNNWNSSIFGNFWGNYTQQYPNANPSYDGLIWDVPYEIFGSSLDKDYFPLVDQPDLIAPTWDLIPEDQIIEYGNGFCYEINASDPSGIDQFDIKTSGNFTINKTTGIINNKSINDKGTYKLKIFVNDTFGNINFTSFEIKIKNESGPIWNPKPLNQTIELGTDFYYDTNASDLSGIDQFWINYSTPFQIDPKNGSIFNNEGLHVNEYWIKITVNDTLGNNNFTIIKITVQDTIEPKWNPKPSDQTIDFNTAFSYELNAKDLSSLIYSINDTDNFDINNETGLITNNTFLSIGNYWLEITAEDIYGNYNKTTIKVKVEETTIPTEPNQQNIPNYPPIFFILVLNIGIITCVIIKRKKLRINQS